MTYLELLSSAINNAMRGMLPEQSVNVDAIAIADTLFPVVSQEVCIAAAVNPRKRSLLRRQKTVTIAAGSAILTDDVLTQYIADAVLYKSTNLSLKYAYRDYPDFVRAYDRRLGYFTIQGEATLLVRDPNQLFPMTAAGARLLTIPCTVLKPATADTEVDAPDEIQSDLIEALSEALRGQLIEEAA
jgi:hypothetical protein